ncbi:VOC family protein [Emcibacter sp.]|uniref:VOC family protein n=1 Tax=Emcibacter sp. TaxID=1979954 RepID=UPI002AA71B7E|nr:VOC family protein [Emcibacter sp.]
MKRVVGPGGFFIKVKDREKLQQWYERHLGVEFDGYNSMKFQMNEDGENPKESYVLISMFKEETDYFGPHGHSFMFNFRVDDLDRVVAELEAEGVDVLPEREDGDYGKFAWIFDPEGHKIELWEPPLKAALAETDQNTL